MPTHHTPGVTFEWQDRRFSGVSLARADIAGFVGIAVRGPVGKPVRIDTWNQFASTFGTHTAAGYLAYAVQGFFANGGRRCWVVRVASASATAARWDLFTADGQAAMSLDASSPGTWAKHLAVSIKPVGLGLFNLEMSVPDGSRETWHNLDIQKPFVDLREGDAQSFVRVTVEAPELWQSPPMLRVSSGGAAGLDLSVGGRSMSLASGSRNLAGFASAVQAGALPLSVQLVAGEPTSVKPNFKESSLPNGPMRFTTSPRFVGRLLNDGRSGSHLAVVKSIFAVPSLRGLPVCHGGSDGLSDLTPRDFEDGLAQLAGIDEIAILAMPDILNKPQVTVRYRRREVSCIGGSVIVGVSEPTTEMEMPPPFDREQMMSLQQSMLDQCTVLKDRVAILDAVSPADNAEIANAWRQQFNSTYGACYYPWILVPDLLQSDGMVKAVPPCGHVAGIFARVEHMTGVHKPPANEVMEGVEDVTIAIDDAVHGLLNDDQLNVIRAYRGRRVRVAGARTLASSTGLRFLNVRRLFIAIERSVRMSLQWITFEPSSPALWLQVDRVMRGLLEDLWMRGFLDGETREDAYSVTCNETTNLASDIDDGRVTCEIGILPPWPAEFVIVRIGISEGAVEMLSPAEAQVA